MILPGVTFLYMAESAAGVHQRGDTYRIALYRADANIGPTTDAYTPAGEVVGAGYRAGGLDLGPASISVMATGASLSFPPAVWRSATITAAGAMVYNATRGNRAVAVIRFARPVTSTEGDFAVRFDAGGLIEWGNGNG